MNDMINQVWVDGIYHKQVVFKMSSGKSFTVPLDDLTDDEFAALAGVLSEVAANHYPRETPLWVP